MFKSVNTVYAVLKSLSVVRGKISVLYCSVNLTLVSRSHFPKFLTPVLNQDFFFFFEWKKTVEGLFFAVVFMFMLQIWLDCSQ